MMTNNDKAELARLVKEEVFWGSDMKTTVKRLRKYGFTDSTIRKYYRTFGGKQ